MKIYHKFSCIPCGQHNECALGLLGRQSFCPICLHPIAIQMPPALESETENLPARNTGNEVVPLPEVEPPARYRSRMESNPVLSS
jgi:hypothetical protein